jgi:hypothetical protein
MNQPALTLAFFRKQKIIIPNCRITVENMVIKTSIILWVDLSIKAKIAVLNLLNIKGL